MAKSTPILSLQLVPTSVRRKLSSMTTSWHSRFGILRDKRNSSRSDTLSIVVLTAAASYTTSPNHRHTRTWTDGERDSLIIVDLQTSRLSHLCAWVTSLTQRPTDRSLQHRVKSGHKRTLTWFFMRRVRWLANTSRKCLWRWRKRHSNATNNNYRFLQVHLAWI